jgi:signal transduction histidine kinase
MLLSWLIDSFYEQLPQSDSPFQLENRVLLGVINQVNQIPIELRASKVLVYSDDFDLPFEYKLGDSIALPHALQKQMLTEKGLIIESDEGVNLLKSSPELFPDHIELKLPSPPIQNNHDIILTLVLHAGMYIFMWFILWPLARRLNILTDAAKQFASGDMNTRISVNNFTYIKEVELTFNRMASQIEKLLAENKLMASSLSHDIRTPVACLRFGLDAALDEDEPPVIHQYLTRMENDLDQMEDMLTSYLSFSTLEQKSHLLKFEKAIAHEYLTHLTSQLQPKLNNSGVTLELEVSKQITFEADLHWLARAITNLVSNACNYAKNKVLVSAHETQQKIILTVEDDGKGIAPENWHKVFDPFFREQTHRSREANNYGLGLAIVHKVVDWHHGNVYVCKSEQLGGAKFTMSFYKYKK